ncbi:MAG: hybrid sensor histidine kinase/response regulator [Armatimonadetes bacterium]|nr:hybrid sensor histidine kinase/response regulator [Armatimonadota bacterium]
MENCNGSVLIVDDDTITRDLLSTNLHEAGYRVEAAEDGVQALDLLHRQPFDAVLLDLIMPNMDGFQVLEQMKADDSLRHIPVIVISAVDEMESVVRCIQMGATDHLPKPFAPVFLHARIRASVEKKQLHDRELHLFGQLQENYRKLQELEKLRDDLTHMIVHDLRTPLTALLTGLLTLEDSGKVAEDYTDILNISIRGGRTLLGMVNDLLDISKMEKGALNLEYNDLTPAGLFEAAVPQVKYLAEERHLTLTTDLPPGLPAFPGDEGLLVRTFVNLMGNAIKFTPAEGTVTVSARRPSSNYPAPRLPNCPALLFSVSDTGEGIPEECRDRIFEKFGQVETRESGRKLSTGLGLTFCKMAVEAHSGAIWVESTPGQGSTFYFTIPLQSRQDSTAHNQECAQESGDIPSRSDGSSG